MNNKKISILPILIMASLLAILSFSCAYKITNVKSLNKEIALMLTPQGIVNNLVLTNDHYLRQYYYQKATSRTGDDSNKIYIIISLILFVDIFILATIYRKQNHHDTWI